jgi:segregation and condensation protein B
LVGTSHPLIPFDGGREFACGSPSAREWALWQWRTSPREPAARMLPAASSGALGEKTARLEAALFVAEGPLSAQKLCQFALLADVAETKQHIEELNRTYDEDGSAFRVERVAGGFQLLTRPELAYWLDQLHQRQAELKLSPPALETLTIIAYRQPITRADIEEVRGVQCAEIIKHLMDRGLVKIGGEEDSLGRPYLYATTRSFLESFGLRSLNELPNADQLRRKSDETPGSDLDPDAEIGSASAIERDDAHDSAA